MFVSLDLFRVYMKKKLLLSVIVCFAFFLFWELMSRSYDNLLFVLPPPSAIFLRLWEKPERFFFHSKITFQVMSGGLTLAFLVAFPLAWLMSTWDLARFFFQPLFVVTQCIPMFTLAPLMVLWFGWTYTAIVIPTALMIFFPLTMSIYQGLKSTPQSLIDYFKINHATSFQIFRKLQLPWALPHIFSGFKISAAIAGIGAIAGEWAGAQSGLGVLMLESRRATDLETTFAALSCLALVSLTFYTSIVCLEKALSVRKFRSLYKKIFSISLLFFLMTSCHSEETKESDVRLALDWLPNANHIPLYVGVEKGFFAKRGIDLKVIKIQDPSETLPLVVANQVEIGLYYMPDIIRANKKGAQLKPLAILFKQSLNGLIYRTQEGITSPRDFTGRNVGYCIDGTDTKVLDYILSQHQILPKSKRNVSFDLVTALGTKQVDFIYGAYWNIECEHLRALGVETDYFSLVDLKFPEYYELVFVAHENSLQAKPLFIEAFKEGLHQSIVYAVSHPEESFEIYKNFNRDKSFNTLKWEKAAWHRTLPLFAENQELDGAVWRNYADWMEEQGLNN
jgi:NitT/TauT family transport system substrate-binding protein